jgi:uncharacterized membrane protein YhiD involved in acid resistance
MWLAGALGMCAGLGFYAIGLFVAVLALVILVLLKPLDARLETARGAGGRAQPPKT